MEEAGTGWEASILVRVSAAGTKYHDHKSKLGRCGSLNRSGPYRHVFDCLAHREWHY